MAFSLNTSYTYETRTSGGTTYTTPLISSERTTYRNYTVSSGYQYNNVGYLTARTDVDGPVYQYEYDSLGQLTYEYYRGDDSNKSDDRKYYYTYDQAGNITSKIVKDYYNNVLDTKSYVYGDSSWGDLLTNYNGTNISYDGIGNPLNWRGIVGMSWEGRQLKEINKNDFDYCSYEYNSSGIRTKKTLGADTYPPEIVEYIVDGSKILNEKHTYQGTTTYMLSYYYDENGGIHAMSYGGNMYYCIKNIFGDVIRLIDWDGNTVVNYEYDAWGNIISITGSRATTLGRTNPFRYRGYYYDTETGWYYLNSRYYDPSVGRFINADGLIYTENGIQGFNMFSYCHNNPVNMSDSSGKLPEWMEKAGNAIGSFFRKAGSAIASGAKSVGSAIASGAKAAWKWVKGFFEVKEKAEQLGDVLTLNEKITSDYNTHTQNVIDIGTGASTKPNQFYSNQIIQDENKYIEYCKTTYENLYLFSSLYADVPENYTWDTLNDEQKDSIIKLMYAWDRQMYYGIQVIHTGAAIDSAFGFIYN